MQLQEFFDYKNQLMDDLLTNQKIIELINHNITLDNAKELVYFSNIPLRIYT